MERNNGTIRKILIIINCLLTVGALFFGYQELKKTEDNKKNLAKLEEKYSQLESDIAAKEKDADDIQEQIDYLNNVEENILAERDKLFKLASELEQKIRNGETDKKIAYLTFDDGPYYNTYKVLSILKEKRVKATFFTTTVNGEYCYDNKSARCFDLYKEYMKGGHTIANHTYTHGIWRGLYSSTDSFINAVERQEEHIKNYADGYVTNILRFPGGSSTAGRLKNSIIERLRAKGYGWVDWTAQDGDGGSMNDWNTGWRNFTNSIGGDIEVVLYHDYHKVTTNMLPNMIDYLRERNYILLPLFYDSVMINK